MIPPFHLTSFLAIEHGAGARKLILIYTEVSIIQLRQLADDCPMLLGIGEIFINYKSKKQMKLKQMISVLFLSQLILRRHFLDHL